ncbi:unnamed protein product, partial [Closterium sp. NIES-54]
GGTGGAATAGPGGARTGDTGVAGTGARGTSAEGAGAGGAGAIDLGAGGTGTGGVEAEGAGAVDPKARGAAGTMRPRLYFVPLLQQVLGVLSSTGLTPPLLCPPPDQTQPSLQAASPVHTGRRVPRPRPPPVPSTHAMTLRPSSVPLCVPLPPPPESTLPAVYDP